MDNNEQHADGIKKSIDEIIGVDTFLKRKKKTEDNQHKERFVKIIQTLEEIEVRGMILGNDLQLDFTSYDDKLPKSIPSRIVTSSNSGLLFVFNISVFNSLKFLAKK